MDTGVKSILRIENPGEAIMMRDFNNDCFLYLGGLLYGFRETSL